jgi:hypothetical protein
MSREAHSDLSGRHRAVLRSGRGRQVFAPGSEGERRLTETANPDTVDEPELAERLADLFHDAVTPLRGEAPAMSADRAVP